MSLRSQSQARRDFWLLVAAWLCVAIARMALGAWMPTPQIVTDEIRFIGMAHNVSTGDFRGPFSTFVQYPFGLYPALLAPLFHWLPAHAYAASKVLNALLISSACFPSWLLARRALPRRWARSVALLALLLPGLGYASNVMAENLFYPLSLWTLVLGLGWTTTRRARWGVALALCGGALVCTKAQAAYLLLALAAWPLLPAFGGTWRERAAWVARFCAAGVGAAAAAVAEAYLRLGASLRERLFDPFTWLGYYASYLHTSAPRQWVHEVMLWAGNCLGSGSELLPIVGIAAFAAAVDAALRGRRRAARLLAPLCLVLWVLFTREGIRLALYFDGALNAHNRYTAQLAPLFLILAAEVYRRRGPAALRAAVSWALVPGVAAAAILVRRIRSDHLVNDSPGLSWLAAVPAPAAPIAFIAAGLLAAAAVWWLAARPQRLVLGLAVFPALTSLGMADSQHRLASSGRRRKVNLVPFATQLASRGQRVFYLMDELDIWQIWMAEAFTGEGEGYAYCFGDGGGLCNPAGLDSDGRLRILEELPAGSLLVTSDAVVLSAPLVASEGPYRAYQLTGEPLRIVSHAHHPSPYP